jgi:hypothetical protein
MLLYTNQNGNWAGNLADAKKMGGTIIKKSWQQHNAYQQCNCI